MHKPNALVVVLSFEAENLSARADRVDHELRAVTDAEPLDTAFRR
jgi:hypothetical protein